jgi:N-acetylglucosaminyl-diphospho-decaprenol L-rhamnosyltransferase
MAAPSTATVLWGRRLTAASVKPSSFIAGMLGPDLTNCAMVPSPDVQGRAEGASVPTVAVVMVTYNSDASAGRAVRGLFSGTRPPQEVVIVDNASRSNVYLEEIAALDPRVRVLRQRTNLGFCAGNNIGLRALGAHTYVLFLNPDAFVAAEFLARAVDLLEGDPDIGAMNPKLLTADPITFAATGRLDAVGIFQMSYGRWFDRGRGEQDGGQYDGPAAAVPALCGAALFCRQSALAQVAPGGAVFDERFFMYKEDIDLSLRLARAGWRLVVDPSLAVLHVRGTFDRMAMPFWVRRRSLVNEWRIWLKGLQPAHRVPSFAYLAGKTLLVVIGR